MHGIAEVEFFQHTECENNNNDAVDGHKNIGGDNDGRLQFFPYLFAMKLRRNPTLLSQSPPPIYLAPWTHGVGGIPRPT